MTSSRIESFILERFTVMQCKKKDAKMVRYMFLFFIALINLMLDCAHIFTSLSFISLYFDLLKIMSTNNRVIIFLNCRNLMILVMQTMQFMNSMEKIYVASE